MPTRIETPRLILRTPEPGDAPGLHSVLGDPETMRFIPSGVMASLADTAARIERRVALETRYGMTAWRPARSSAGRGSFRWS